jgi:hypothetical protein
MSAAIPPLPQYAFMAWCSVKAQGQLYLYLLLDKCEWVASRPDRFIQRDRVLGPHCIWSYVGPKTAQDAVAKRQISFPAPAAQSW